MRIISNVVIWLIDLFINNIQVLGMQSRSRNLLVRSLFCITQNIPCSPRRPSSPLLVRIVSILD